MPKSRTVLKRQRKTLRQTERNKSVRSLLKTQEKRVRSATPDNVAAELEKFFSLMDKAAQSGVVHSNKADRKKSRLAKFASTVSG